MLISGHIRKKNYLKLHATKWFTGLKLLFWSIYFLEVSWVWVSVNKMHWIFWKVFVLFKLPRFNENFHKILRIGKQTWDFWSILENCMREMLLKIVADLFLKFIMI